MAISMPIAAYRIAKIGCVATKATKVVMGDSLRLSFESLLPAADRFERLSGGLSATRRSTLRDRTMARGERQPDQYPDSWRGDGRMLMARNHMLNVMPSQKNPKSKAFASA